MYILTARSRTYQKHIGVLVETSNLYTLLGNRDRVLPWLSDGMTNHLLRLAAVKLRFGRLTRNDDTNLWWEIHRFFSIATVDYRKFGLLQDSVVCCNTVNRLET
jgi:hypothetical protein